MDNFGIMMDNFGIMIGPKALAGAEGPAWPEHIPSHKQNRPTPQDREKGTRWGPCHLSGEAGDFDFARFGMRVFG